MRLEERRTLKVVLGLGALGVLAPVVYLTGLFFLGLSVASDLPPIAGTPVPPLLKHALWARAGGGRATELRSVNPINGVGYIACRELRDIPDNPRSEDQPRADDCAGWLPAIQGLEYLSNLHVRDSGVERNSFRGGAGSFATMLRLSASWTREDFLNTLAARAGFGHGWRGVDAAARAYFATTPDQLALHEAAMIAAIAGEHDSQPWCHPDATTELRNRILARMHNNGAISDTDFRAAEAMPLGLAAPPAGHKPCVSER